MTVRVTDVQAALHAAGVTNPRVRDYVHYYANLTEVDRIEVVGPADDARLIREALAAGELQPAG